MVRRKESPCASWLLLGLADFFLEGCLDMVVEGMVV